MPRPRVFLSVLLACLAAVTLSLAADREEGFEPLFNGKDLSGWQVVGGKKEVWQVDNGLLVTTRSGGGWLLTEKEYADFELRLEYRWEKDGGNSGVALRAPLAAEVSSKGIEVQLIDDDKYEKVHGYKLKPTQHTGSIYGVVPPAKLSGKGPGEWNRIRIVARGPKITVELNGEKVNEANLQDHKEHAGEHPGILRTRGRVGVQSHDGRVEFRRLRIKPL